MNIRTLLIRTCYIINPSRVNRRFLHQKFLNADLNFVSESGIKSQLTEFSIPYEDGYTCLRLSACLCCQLSNSKKSGEIFINKRTGFFLCENCKATGDWSNYSRLLRDIKIKKDYDSTYTTQQWDRYDRDLSGWKEVVATTEALGEFTESDHSNVLREFKIPYGSRVVSSKLQVRINEDRTLLFFPLSLKSSKSAIVGYKTYDKNGKENTFPKTECPGFLLHSGLSNSSAVVVANITDFLALVSVNFKAYDVICLQYGTSHLPQSTLPFFENYNKLILWLGEGTLDATTNFARKLIEKRCYVIRPNGNQVSVSLALSKNENINEILSNAKLSWHQFITTFSRLRDEILVEFQNNCEADGVPWKRFPQLTKILKGHRRGELTILTGPTGVGKTTFLSEYSLDLAMQGVNTLWGSFELKNTRLAKIMLTQFVEGPVPEDFNEFNALCDRFEELPFFFLTFHGQQHVSLVMDAIEHCSYTNDIAHVIIDNVQFMTEISSDLAQFDRFWKQDFMIQLFRRFATNYNCHVTLVMHPKKTEGVDLNINSIFGGVKASQEADNVIIIQKNDLSNFGVKKYLQNISEEWPNVTTKCMNGMRNERLKRFNNAMNFNWEEEGEETVNVIVQFAQQLNLEVVNEEVCKNRYSGDLGLFHLRFDRPSLCFSKASRFTKPPEGHDDFRFMESSHTIEEFDEKNEHQGCGVHGNFADTDTDTCADTNYTNYRLH